MNLTFNRVKPNFCLHSEAMNAWLTTTRRTSFKHLFLTQRKSLKDEKPQLRPMNVIRSHHHEVFTEQVNKIALSADDDKRIILPDRQNTFAHGFQGWGQTERPKDTQRGSGKDMGPWGGEFLCNFGKTRVLGWRSPMQFWASLRSWWNKQTKKRAGRLNPQFPTTHRYI